MARDSTKKAYIAARAIYEKKAEKIVILDMRKEPCPCDYFVIAETGSKRRLLACARGIQQELKKVHCNIGHVEGEKEALWILIDSESVVIHLFLSSLRDYYDLEGLWRRSPRIYYEETLHKK